jgi:ATP-dependent protease HslVU (ClpYQ) peptidase subunit
MTVICYKDGIIAADTRLTHCDAGIMRGTKLFRKRVGRRDHILGFAGHMSYATVYLDWYCSGKPMPDQLRSMSPDNNFSVLILIGKQLYEADSICRPVEVEAKFHAVGSGAQAALGAMRYGASALEAANIACDIDPTCGRPIVLMSTQPTKRGSKT